MILIESGSRTTEGFEAALILAWQLAELGHRPRLLAASLPEDPPKRLRFQAAPFVADAADLAVRHVLVTGAEQLDDATLAALRDLGLVAGATATALGNFSAESPAVHARAKLSYALGREVSALDLAALQPRRFHPAAPIPLIAGALGQPIPPAAKVRIAVAWPPATAAATDDEDPPEPFDRWTPLAFLPNAELRFLVEDEAAEPPRPSFGYGLFQASDLAPTTFAAMTDILIVTGAAAPSLRVAAMATAMLGAGGIVIDATLDGLLAQTGAPVLRAPPVAEAVTAYLQQTVIANRGAILDQIALPGPWLAGHARQTVERALGIPTAPSPAARPTRKPREILFVPTNGVGLGHAQRLLQIAPAVRKPGRCRFAAFPSCTPLIEAAGFACLPLLAKSDRHVEPFANDLANYLRLRRSATEGGMLVFDGGYVFDSILRTITERRMTGVWVRRGLWQPFHLGGNALEREKVFTHVLVPQEAFDELNDHYSFGPHVHPVGPVVQERVPEGREALRCRIAERVGRRFDRLVVSMLGGGVAADRTAQLQTIAATLEGRPDLLHLVLVWPGSVINPALHGWKTTQVVYSRDGLSLAAAADAVISAAGYNSFHEVLYHKIPAILIPQTAPFMDDQDRRARAAADRGAAVRVEPHELMRLAREVMALLDGGGAARLKTALARLALPATGQKRAAKLIGEWADHDG